MKHGVHYEQQECTRLVSFTSQSCYFVGRSKFVSPKLSEGFNEIVNVNFVPQFDGNSKDGALYRHFLMEK